MLLFRVLFVLVTLVLGGIVHGLSPCTWFHPPCLIAASFAASYVITWLAGNASRGVALRKVVGAMTPDNRIPNPPAGTPNAKRWYIESVPPENGLPHSCSFVELDERGDYLDFNQHRHAYETIAALAGQHEKLIVVIFVHGWRNNGQSGNVLSFNEFLNQLATFSDDSGVQHRVHGLYLSWRGACLKHVLDLDPTYHDVTTRYGGDPIVDLQQAARFPRLNQLVESFSYFDRKGVPEHLTSGTSLSRTLFTCAHAAKCVAPQSHVFLIGHSFGGLMLERTFQNAAIGELISAWPWERPDLIAKAKANPLPFDTVLLVNSAAPSIYAKQFQSFLAAHRHAMLRNNIAGSNSPVFFSLTSSNDSATGQLHPLANTFCFLVPTLRRNYPGDDFILAPEPGREHVSIPQSYYYRHTPGHNPLLVNRFIEPAAPSPSTTPESRSPSGRVNHFHANLRHSGPPLQFTTSPRDNGPGLAWSINFPPGTETFKAFSTYKANGKVFLPVAWEESHRQTAYWIVRCTKEIIKDHNDIWSQQAMDTYAALYKISLAMRNEPPPVP